MVARCALPYMLGQVDSGVNCPLTMTFAALPALEGTAVGKEWIPRITAAKYDARDIPVEEKEGATMGMFMTEKQGGSDVRANTTRATALGGNAFALVGHKWFASAPMCDGFLTLAYTNEGIGCFLLPRFLPDGRRNDGWRIQQTKDKLGDRSNAGTEVEYVGAYAELVGEVGRGLPTIMSMVMHTRLDCCLGSAATMRMAVSQAAHHCAHRAAFGGVLNKKPLMQNVLADLEVEAEAATMLAMRLAFAFEEADRGNAEEAAFARIATAISKYYLCKRAPSLVYEAMECHGGNGFVEDSIMPRLYRQAPLNSIWEGSGNVICLDVLRAMGREPDAIPALFQELSTAKGMDATYDGFVENLQRDLVDWTLETMQGNGRMFVERMALALQASLLLRNGHPAVSAAFVTSRLTHKWGNCFGTLPAGDGLDLAPIVDRATPVH